MTDKISRLLRSENHEDNIIGLSLCKNTYSNWEDAIWFHFIAHYSIRARYFETGPFDSMIRKPWRRKYKEILGID